LERRIERETDQHERALRESHKRLLRVIDAVPAMISATTSTGRYAFINSYQANLFGVGPDEASGKTAVELLDNDYSRKAHTLDLEIFESGDAPPSFEEMFITPKGVQRIFLTTKSPVRNDLGRITHVVTVSLDITDRKEAEAALIEAKEGAELANRTKSEFLANMSHELRTPLNAIVGFAQVIRSEVFGPVGQPKYLEYCRDIENSGGLLCQIIEDILDVSKIEAGTIPINEDTVGVAALIEDVRRLASERAKLANIKIETRLVHPDACLWVDPSKLKQILLNLLTNAIKFTPAGGKVTINAQAVRGGFRIVVADTGIGMDEEELKVAITRFGRVEGPIAASQPGTGLGLTLAIDLAKLHGGEVAIESRKDHGTRVTVTLPADRVVEVVRKRRKITG
ncbi:MAG: PAS domain-containing sensor histidine kinase, partial [Inquilinus sp.]|nr:PAS domain-containing sensor histidine kinase [Inquilinus sp.]